MREHWPQPLLQRCPRKCADDSVDLFALPHYDEQRDRLGAELGSKPLIRVDVDLHDLQVTRVTFRKVFEHRRDHPTRPAPGSPEVDDHRHRRGGLGHERVGVRVDDPRQRRLAPRASRNSLRDRTDTVARPAGRAADDRHQHQGGAQCSGPREARDLSHPPIAHRLWLRPTGESQSRAHRPSPTAISTRSLPTAGLAVPSDGRPTGARRSFSVRDRVEHGPFVGLIFDEIGPRMDHKKSKSPALAGLL